MRIFLSHASTDSALVEQIKAAIGSRAAVYCAEYDIQAGVDVHKKIKAELRKSDLMIVLLTRRGVRSGYVNQEIGFADRDGKLIVPMVAEGIPGSRLGMLEGIEYILLGADPVASIERLRVRIDALYREEALRMLALGVLLVVLGVALAAAD